MPLLRHPVLQRPVPVPVEIKTCSPESLQFMVTIQDCFSSQSFSSVSNATSFIAPFQSGDAVADKILLENDW